MPETWYYYCEKCREYVMPELAKFQHPHGGEKSCMVCRKCGGMVYLKEQEKQEA
jgi:predicted SprT family Zn-dependent metalloprotease